MKIAHIVSTYPPYRGGMGNVAAAMHEELRRRGHDSCVLTPAYGPDQPEQGIKRLHPWLSYRNSAFIPQIGRHLQGVEVIHLHYPFYGGAEAVAWYRKRHPQTKMVLTYHMDTVGTGLVGLFFRLYQKFVQPWVVRTSDVIMASSLDYANHSQLSQYPHLRLEELPFGVADDFQPDLTKKQSGGPLRVLFVGGLDQAHYFKGLSVLIEALSLCRLPVALDVAGSGDLQKQYQQRAQLMKVADRIRFLGALPRTELIHAYQGADVTILPSVDRSEAFGLVLLESMACQTPVIASDLPGVRTLARQGQTGLVVPPGDAPALAEAIDRLAGDRATRRLLGEQAHQVVERDYRWKRIIDKLETIYQSL